MLIFFYTVGSDKIIFMSFKTEKLSKEFLRSLKSPRVEMNIFVIHCESNKIIILSIVHVTWEVSTSRDNDDKKLNQFSKMMMMMIFGLMMTRLHMNVSLSHQLKSDYVFMHILNS